MENMLNFAEAQTVANTAHTLDLRVILVALGLAEPAAPAVEEPAAEPAAENSLSIVFDNEDECQAFEVERNGVIARFMKNQQVWCQVSDSRGNHQITAKMTRVFFVNKNGALIGETAILPIVETQAVAEALVWRGGVMPEGDIVKVLDWKF